MLRVNKHAVAQHAQNTEPKPTPQFGNFTQSVLDELEKIAYPIRYPEGFVLFAEGDAPRGVFIVRSGSLKVSICSGDGKALIVRMAGPGDVLGLPGTISGKPYEVTAQTLSPCDVEFIKREPFLGLMQARIEVCRAVADQLVSLYSNTCREIRCIGLPHAACGKLARLLLDWPLSNGDTPYRLTIGFTHEEIAQMIGTSRETVSRLLADFKRRHIAELNSSTLQIHNRDSLQALAAGARLSSKSKHTRAEQDWGEVPPYGRSVSKEISGKH